MVQQAEDGATAPDPVRDERGEHARLPVLVAPVGSIASSPLSATSRSGPLPSGRTHSLFVHQRYSGMVSPFQANAGTSCASPTAAPSATVLPLAGSPTSSATSAWSCMEKMWHLTQLASAPRTVSVSVGTSVWTVMCRLPLTFGPTGAAARHARAGSPSVPASAQRRESRYGLAGRVRGRESRAAGVRPPGFSQTSERLQQPR